MLCLRLAILFHMVRSDVQLPAMKLVCVDGQCTLELPGDWLAANTLTNSALKDELAAWQNLAPTVRLAALRAV